MKLLTAVIAPDRLPVVTTALDGAGLTASTVASAHASSLTGGRTLGYRGVNYRDQRCVRLEILVGDLDVATATALLQAACGPAEGDFIAWTSDIEDLATLYPADGRRDLVAQS